MVTVFVLFLLGQTPPGPVDAFREILHRSGSTSTTPSNTVRLIPAQPMTEEYGEVRSSGLSNTNPCRKWPLVVRRCRRTVRGAGP